MPDYIAKSLEYKTNQGDMWDIVSLREYGDEHAMNFIQDANFYQRFTDAFPATVLLAVPALATVHYDLKTGVKIPPLSELLPWR